MPSARSWSRASIIAQWVEPNAITPDLGAGVLVDHGRRHQASRAVSNFFASRSMLRA